MTGEFALIERLRTKLPGAPPGETWIGDDAACIRFGGRWLLLAADVVVAGVHADLSRMSLDDLGWKALTVNVSDIAAMGGHPLHALVCVTIPPDGADVDLLYEGLAEAATTYECPIVGGDLSVGPGMMISVAVTGTVDDGDPVLRRGARPGDTLFVTGPLGAAAASTYRHRPRARVAEGAAARVAGATAMIDISDGLAADLRHLADESEVGAVVDVVPRAEGASLEHVVGGGEDYELLFAAPDAGRIAEVLPDAIGIGVCTADPTERRLLGGPLPSAGWEHTWPD